MPLTPFLDAGAFDRRTVETMTQACYAVCWSLQLEDRSGSRFEIIARKIIEIAQTGERDPKRICAMTLLALSGRTTAKSATTPLPAENGR